MPLDRLALKNQAEKDITNSLAIRNAAIPADLAKVADITAGSRKRFANTITNLSPGMEGAASASAQPFVQDLKNQDTQALLTSDINQRRNNVNQTFNFMLDRLQSAGVDRAQAEQVAQKFALEQDARDAKTKENQVARDQATKKQDMTEAYARRLIQIQQDAANEQRKNALKSALYRSFFGLVGVGIGAAVAGPIGAAAGSTVTSQVAAPVASSTSYGPEPNQLPANPYRTR